MDEPFVFQVGRIRRALRREFEARAAELGITVAQYVVLKTLWQEDGMLTSLLAKAADCDGSTMTGLLDRLEAKGLLRRERCPEDRRAVRVFITPAGRELEAPLMEILTAMNQQALEGLTADDRGCLARCLARIGANLGAE